MVTAVRVGPARYGRGHQARVSGPGHSSLAAGPRPRESRQPAGDRRTVALWGTFGATHLCLDKRFRTVQLAETGTTGWPQRVDIGILGGFGIIRQRLESWPVRGHVRSGPPADCPQPLREPARITESGQGAASVRKRLLRRVFRQVAVRQPAAPRSPPPCDNAARTASRNSPGLPDKRPQPDPRRIETS